MKRTAWLYAALLALALAAGLAGPTAAPDSPVPSVKNPGPRGTKLLRRYLEQTGRDVRILDTGFDLPSSGTLVLVAPTGHAVSPAELDAIKAFVANGGTLVYLRARRSAAQQRLDAWLQLEAGPAPSRDAQGDDLLGVSDPVTLLPGLTSLRVLADDTVVSTLPGAVPVTQAKSLWWAKLQRGEAFIGAGPDLAEASRLELEGNAAFWASLPQPLAFDELHQAPKAAPDLSANLVAAIAQLAFCALAFLLALAPRLGPPRPTLQEQHRSTLEYVTAMAALTREARVEPELAVEVCRRLQRVLDLKEHELPVKPDGIRTPQEFLALSRRCAALEAGSRGLSSRT